MWISNHWISLCHWIASYILYSSYYSVAFGSSTPSSSPQSWGMLWSNGSLQEYHNRFIHNSLCWIPVVIQCRNPYRNTLSNILSVIATGVVRTSCRNIEASSNSINSNNCNEKNSTYVYLEINSNLATILLVKGGILNRSCTFVNSPFSEK